jgi:hypothetical protein
MLPRRAALKTSRAGSEAARRGRTRATSPGRPAGGGIRETGGHEAPAPSPSRNRGRSRTEHTRLRVAAAPVVRVPDHALHERTSSEHSLRLYAPELAASGQGCPL